MSDVDILGIDLGTTKSVIAIWDPQTEEPRIIPNPEGDHITPSIVTFSGETDRAIVGKAAMARMLGYPEEVIYSVKRFIGRTPDDEWVRYDREHVAYNIEEDAEHHVMIEAGGRKFTPQQISAEVLRRLKNNAEVALDERQVTQAVISVPAYFNEPQRHATQQAGELAGLFVPRIIPEPTAAALAFGLGETVETVAIYDLGGGTFDISVLRIKDGLFKVKALGGHTHLGGDDFDQAIVAWMKERFEEEHQELTLPVETDNSLHTRLREAAQRAKVMLTDVAEYHISLPELLIVDGKSRGLETILTRATFEALIQAFIDESLQLMDETLEKAGVRPADISQILMVGGQTRTLAIRDAIRERYGRPINTTIKPEEAVARGAAILGARLCGYLEERVALWEVIPLSLGVELADGSMAVIIPANEPIPTERRREGSQAFTTHRDRQESIKFNVYQGERPIAADNTFIGEVILPLATPRRAGEHRINCSFRVDANGILAVRAKSADSEEEIKAEFKRGLPTVAEVQAKLQEAEANRIEDELTSRLFSLRKEVSELQASARGQQADDLFIEGLAAIEAAMDERDANRAAQLLTNLRNRSG